MKKYLYVVRHGETDYNAQGICQGQLCNIGLNQKGREQALELASRLKDAKIGAIYCSPLLRAKETAEIIADSLSLSVVVNNGIIEGNFGVSEGKPMAEIRTWPIYRQWTSPDPKYDHVHYENGESKQEIRQRVIRTIEEICSHEQAEHILIVAHSAIVRAMHWATGNCIQGMPNGSVFNFVYEDGKLYKGKEKILLLSCCAPCSCAVIKTLAEQKKDFSVVFYNPNIRPFAEYQKRLLENKRVCLKYGVDFIELEYDNERWCRLTEGLEDEPERGKRCDVCFYMRLKRVMEYAKENGYTAVSSVLGVSRYKNLEQVQQMACKAGAETGVFYVDIEGRKNGMQELRLQLIEELGLYNQNYCGCKPRDQ